MTFDHRNARGRPEACWNYVGQGRRPGTTTAPCPARSRSETISPPCAVGMLTRNGFACACIDRLHKIHRIRLSVSSKTATNITDEYDFRKLPYPRGPTEKRIKSNTGAGEDARSFLNDEALRSLTNHADPSSPTFLEEGTNWRIARAKLSSGRRLGGAEARHRGPSTSAPGEVPTRRFRGEVEEARELGAGIVNAARLNDDQKRTVS